MHDATNTSWQACKRVRISEIADYEWGDSSRRPFIGARYRDDVESSTNQRDGQVRSNEATRTRYDDGPLAVTDQGSPRMR